MEKLTIVKVGGKIVSDPQMLDNLLTSFKAVSGMKILVHGGGNEATELAQRMNVPVVMKEGRRITDDAMLEIVAMVYGGLLNKKVVALLQAKGVNAIGLSGADGNIILSDRRPVKTIDYGNVGDVKSVQTENVDALLKGTFVPVICALTHDGQGHLLNTNADTIASVIAEYMASLYEVDLCYCFELNGVLKDFSDKNSVISEISASTFDKMKNEGIINDGMIPKVFNALNASKSGVQNVYICNYASLQSPENGTRICYQ